MVCVRGNTERSRGEHILGVNGIGRHVKCYTRRQVINNGELYMPEYPPYYTNCPTKKEHVKCDLCNNFIPDIDGTVYCCMNSFWGQKYCPSHENDGTSSCCSCKRLQASAGMEFILLEDGRRLCPECSSFMIMDINDCQPLILEIQQFFATLNMKLDQKIPLALVASETLNKPSEDKDNTHHHLSGTQGLCALVRRPIPIVRMMESMGGFSFMDMLKSYPQLVYNREVDAILVLYGLPRLLTGSVLAHEMMHAWLHLEGYPNLSKPIEEGICEVVAHMWLKSKINVGSETAMAAAASLSSSLQPGRSKKHEQPSEIEKKLGECFIHQIETNNSKAYRIGFKKGIRAVSRYGLKKTLDCLKLYRTFPV
ncbi:protein DA1-related 1-like isoform X1 [Cucurbita moschata]|uniref:Protein DA1-related 1-like isoform X1 n=1 Tax=Cucurbita moschata TaxID=3662 RepID=A0A6J1GCU6_CUCMO|nr:protein DA1-related 1-like isoform X1 [Cucurbita moschata]XP_022949692.1 protein DA1-related 1-like isoform X1 [Cucurbita moschata]XP_022949694.1 protein DA1-related 1-like isoform X1 [Cucurbita moschata]